MLYFYQKLGVITISQKIDDITERKRLLKVVEEVLPNNCGAIIRTSSCMKSEEIIKKDIEELINEWNTILDEGYKNKKGLVYKSKDVLEKILIDFIDKDIEKIITNDELELKRIEKQLKKIGKNVKIELKNDFMQIYKLETEISKINNRKIWIKSGGYITIDKTEALTAIDVNSGKYTGEDGLEKTLFDVNKDATKEIAKQIRLRNIGGIIVIDYINMEKQEDKEKIKELLEEELKKDRTVTQVIGFTRLELLELTRKQIY